MHGCSVWALTWGCRPCGDVPTLDYEISLGQSSLESGLNPLQRFLDPPCLSLAGLLEVGITVSRQEVDARGGEPGNAAAKVGL